MLVCFYIVVYFQIHIVFYSSKCWCECPHDLTVDHHRRQGQAIAQVGGIGRKASSINEAVKALHDKTLNPESSCQSRHSLLAPCYPPGEKTWILPHLCVIQIRPLHYVCTNDSNVCHDFGISDLYSIFMGKFGMGEGGTNFFILPGSQLRMRQT